MSRIIVYTALLPALLGARGLEAQERRWEAQGGVLQSPGPAHRDPGLDAPAQAIGDARKAFVPARQATADTTPSRAVSGLPADAKGGLIGTLLGAATGALLSYAAHYTYCGETSSCDDYPDRSFRDATLVGAGIGFLLGVGIEGLIVDKRERERARIRPDESGEASSVTFSALDGRCMHRVPSLASVCLTFSIPTLRASIATRGPGRQVAPALSR